MSRFLPCVESFLFTGRILTISGSQSISLGTTTAPNGYDTIFSYSPAATGSYTFGSDGVDWYALYICGVGFSSGQTLLAGSSTRVPALTGSLGAQVVHVNTVYGAYMVVEGWSNIVYFTAQLPPPYPFPPSPIVGNGVGDVGGQANRLGNPQSPQDQIGAYVGIQLFRDLETNPFQTVNVDPTKALSRFKISSISQSRSMQVRIFTVGFNAGLDLSRTEFRLLKQPRTGP